MRDSELFSSLPHVTDPVTKKKNLASFGRNKMDLQIAAVPSGLFPTYVYLLHLWKQITSVLYWNALKSALVSIYFRIHRVLYKCSLMSRTLHKFLP